MNQRPAAPKSFDAAAAVLEGFVDVLVERVVADVVARLQEIERDEAVEWRLLSVVEIAEVLGRSERWVRQAVKDRGLPRRHLDDGALAFDLDDVRAWAEARRIPARDEDPLADCLQSGCDPASRKPQRTRRRVANQKVEL